MLVQDIKKVQETFDKPKPTKRRWVFILGLGVIIFLISAIGAMAQSDKIPLYQLVNGLHNRNDFNYEITETYELGDLLDVKFRAYDKDANQFSFGKYGGIEIEHLKIYNQPEYIQLETYSNFPDPMNPGQEMQVHDKQYAPGEALLQTIDRVMKTKKYKFLDKPIQYGTIANTTYVIYSDSDPETTSMDGYLGGYENNSWSYVRNFWPANNWISDNGTQLYASAFIRSDSNPQMTRSILGFDTSVVGSDTVDSAVLSIYPNIVNDTNDADLTCEIADPTNDTYLVSGDWTSSFASSPTEICTRRDMSTFVVNTYENATITESYINTSGLTNIGLRDSHDTDDSAPTGGATSDTLRFYAADNGASMPYLTLEVSSSTPATSTPTTTLTQIGTATSSIDQTQDNIFYAYLMYFVAGFFMVYLLMRTASSD